MYSFISTEREMEECLDLALRKGKAGGEPKPTEKSNLTGG
jgi:hypothetical protein